MLDRWGAEADVRVVGPVRASATALPLPAAARRRVRPLVPGTSVAHPDVTAGTLGAFVTDAEGRVLLLSNNHVLADTDRAGVGDPVLSPGPADGGRPGVDRVATLTAFERFRPEGNLLDLAVAAVDDPALVGGNVVPEGVLTGVVEEVLDGVAVAKTGRTTGHTTGTVTAVELDGVTVDYGRGQVLSFDDCLEVEGDGRAFSDGGDSGSVVYAVDGLAALGLLFAGLDDRRVAGLGADLLQRHGAGAAHGGGRAALTVGHRRARPGDGACRTRRRLLSWRRTRRASGPVARSAAGGAP